MNVIRFWLTLLIPLFLLLACRRSNEADLPATPTDVHDTWSAVVESDEVAVNRRVEIGDRLVTLLRGSPAMAPSSLNQALLESGASSADCRLFDDGQNLAFACDYRYPLPLGDGFATRQLPLPDDSHLSFLASIPIEMAQGIRVEAFGRISLAQGVFARLPVAEKFTAANGGFVLRHYSLASLSELAAYAAVYLPPGHNGVWPLLPVASAGFLPNYLPRSSAWFAFVLALAAALLAIAFLFPAGVQRLPDPGVPGLPVWELDSRRKPFFLRWLVRPVNWLCPYWPRLLNAALGLALTGLGGQLMVTAWGLARLYDEAEQLRLVLHHLTATFPIAGLFQTLLWPGWAFTAALAGILLVALGLALLVRRQAARLLLAGMTITLVGGVILAWPHLLLAPAFFPLQLELFLTAGIGLLLMLALLARALTHPQFRRYYLKGE